MRFPAPRLAASLLLAVAALCVQGNLSAPTAAADTTNPALTKLNLYRSQFGVAPVTENTTWSSAATAHATYMATNNLATHSEDPSLPGYTVAGAESARYSHVAIGYTTPGAFVDAWASSPFHMISMLSPKLVTSAYGQATVSGRTAGDLNVQQGTTGTSPTTGWPRTWPRGTTSILQLSDSSSPDPVVGCGAPLGSWFGTATIVDFGPNATPTSVTATLTENGQNVPICVRTAANYSDATAKALMAGKVLVIPTRPLVSGKAYAGTVTSSSGTASISFDTGNPASGVFGDHDGDGIADILAVRRDTNQLMLYPTQPGATIGQGYSVGQGWGGMNWIATVPDLNGDGRTELAARETSTGNLYVYPGRGRGIFGTRVQVGRGFGGLDQLTVINDITGDGYPELLGRTSSGALMRYSFGRFGTALGGTRQIGQNWGGMARLFSPGDFTGDGLPDLLAVRKDGLLFCYRFSAGQFTTTTQVGRGWSPTDILWSPGDMDGNGTHDLMAIRGGSQLWFYANRGTGWAAGKQIAQGWDVMRLLT